MMHEALAPMRRWAPLEGEMKMVQIIYRDDRNYIFPQLGETDQSGPLIPVRADRFRTSCGPPDHFRVVKIPIQPHRTKTPMISVKPQWEPIRFRRLRSW